MPSPNMYGFCLWKIKKLKQFFIIFSIWAADLAEIGSLSSYNCGVKYLLFVIDAFTKYAWVLPLKDKKTKAVLHNFIETVKESQCTSNR